VVLVQEKLDKTNNIRSKMITKEEIKLIKDNIENINFDWAGENLLQIGIVNQFDIKTRKPSGYTL
jgi:hypothetical protein